MEYRLGIDENISFREDLSLEDAILFSWNKNDELLKIRFALWDDFIVDLKENAKSGGDIYTSILYLPDEYKYKDLKDIMKDKLMKWNWKNDIDPVIEEFLEIK
ncbi:MAG: hypothetical protein GX102_08770 [Porphyromonadaceae bacterium]|nr:hypothetical protein [Porphyromonadaceae bacterium]